jgi:hypothetical protein
MDAASQVNNTDVATQIISDGASTTTTILPFPPVNIEMIPNPDIVATTAQFIDKYSTIDY